MLNFESIDYLKSGTERQQAAFKVLIKYGVMEKLADFDPLLAGTIPIGIDTAQSDLDIICCWSNKSQFKNLLQQSFSACFGFTLKEVKVRGKESIIANFWLDGFEVEVFGQSTPSRQQAAYRHMLIEYKLLQKYGDEFRQKVLQLKRQGIKTEPAFAQLLELPGDPYDALLQLGLD